MRILIIADESFAARERAMLSRLEVGLADESVRVIHAVPRRAAHWYHGEVYSQAVTYQDRGLAISRGWRAQQIVHELEGLVDGEATAVNVVHAFGLGCWPIAVELARLLGAGLAIEVTDP